MITIATDAVWRTDPDRLPDAGDNTMTASRGLATVLFRPLDSDERDQG
jgi:hypothetical protein